MKHSSVEWLALWVYNNTDCKPEEIKKAYQEAKAMHKQEYIDAWMNGQNDSGYYTGKELRQMAQEDYNETFGE